jgi:hypothetical protein
VPSQVKCQVKSSAKSSRVLVVSKAFVESCLVENRSEISRAVAHSQALVVSSGLLVDPRCFEDYQVAEDGYGCPPERCNGALERSRQEFESQLVNNGRANDEWQYSSAPKPGTHDRHNRSR